VLPFHQLGSFKWKELGLAYTLAATPAAPPDLVARVLDQFRGAGCNAR
jgi:pyruvate formate lyase activating enzyme